MRKLFKNVSNIALTLSPFVTTKPVEDWFLAECHHHSEVGRKLKQFLYLIMLHFP